VPVPADGETAAGAVPEEEIGEWQPVVLVEVVLAEPVEQVVLVERVVLVEHTEVAEPVELVELGAEVVAVAAVVAAEYRPPQQQAAHCGQWSPEHTHLAADGCRPQVAGDVDSCSAEWLLQSADQCL